MTDHIALTAALRRLHRTHQLLTRDEAERLATILGIPPEDVQ